MPDAEPLGDLHSVLDRQGELFADVDDERRPVKQIEVILFDIREEVVNTACRPSLDSMGEPTRRDFANRQEWFVFFTMPLTAALLKLSIRAGYLATWHTDSFCWGRGSRDRNLAERRQTRNGRAFPEASPVSLLLFLAHTFEGLIVRFLVNKLSCPGIPLYPPIILRIVGLGPVFYRADPVAISDWGIFRHLCHHLLLLKIFFLCSFAGLLPKFATMVFFFGLSALELSVWVLYSIDLLVVLCQSVFCC